MTTWNPLAERIAQRDEPAVSTGPRSLSLIRATVAIRLRCLSDRRDEAVVVTADIGPAEWLDPLFARALEDRLIEGALAVERRTVVLRRVMFVGNIGDRDRAVAAIEGAVDRLAATAIELATTLAGEQTRLLAS